jgi:hypothetical protein
VFFKHLYFEFSFIAVVACKLTETGVRTKSVRTSPTKTSQVCVGAVRQSEGVGQIVDGGAQQSAVVGSNRRLSASVEFGSGQRHRVCGGGRVVFGADAIFG